MNDNRPRQARHLLDVRALEVFRDEYPDLFRGGLLLHDGGETFWIADRILAAPWHRVI